MCPHCCRRPNQLSPICPGPSLCTQSAQTSNYWWSLSTGEVVAVHVQNFRHSPRVASGILGIAPPVTQQHLLKPATSWHRLTCPLFTA